QDVLLNNLQLDGLEIGGIESAVLSLVSGPNPFASLTGYDGPYATTETSIRAIMMSITIRMARTLQRITSPAHKRRALYHWNIGRSVASLSGTRTANQQTSRTLAVTTTTTRPNRTPRRQNAAGRQWRRQDSNL
ncbi:MAG: hypothetical protein AAF085_15245, partial [Planctomycetota bacterium]